MKVWIFVGIVFHLASVSNSFVVSNAKAGRSMGVNPTAFAQKTADSNSNSNSNSGTALSPGTLIEFTEKGRVHIGKISSLEHKTNGGARYDVIDENEKRFNIADKAVTYSLTLSDERKSKQVLEELVLAKCATERGLQKKLDITPELLEMAWEELDPTTSSVDDGGAAAAASNSYVLTPNEFIHMIHSKKASPTESYMAWRLLREDMAKVFFKELKTNGRVLSFKAKGRKSVEASKETFCSKKQQKNKDDEDDVDDFCFAP